MSKRPPLRFLTRDGITAKELAEKAGVTVRTAQRWTSEPREDFLARAEEKKRTVIKLRTQGLSIREISRRTGYSKSLVHHYAKSNDL